MPEPKEQLHQAKADVQAAQKNADELRLRSREAIGQVKALYAEAAELKKQRDAENEKVHEFKKKRQDAENKAEKIRQELEPLQKHVRSLPRPESPGRLRADLERLEWQQQTEAMSPKAEKDLSRRIKDIRDQLGPAEKLTGIFAQIRPLEENLRAASAELRIYRNELNKHAKASDAHHEAMLKVYKKAQSLSKKIGENLKELDQKRALLDEERKEYFQIQGQVRQADVAERAERAVQEKAERDRIKAEAEAEKQTVRKKAATIAEMALEKFRAGGKLTWEDLQTIQEAGLELK